MALISLEQVRQHLQQMGFHEVPDDVVRELHSELLSRVSSAAPTPPKKTAAAPGKGVPAGYEADESEWEKNDKENDRRPNASQALERLSTGVHKDSDKAKTRPTGAATSVQEASLRDKRPASAPATRSRRSGAGDTDTGQRKDANAQELEQGAGLSAGAGSEGAKGIATARLHPSSSSVFSGARSVTASSSSGLIRPAAQRYGRVCAALRQDPVSSFLNTREQWKRGPAVTAGGTARATVGQISSLQQPDVKNVWKAVHPLQNGTSASSYIVPTAKARTREREQVRQSLAWNEVYKPPKIDRVQVNLESRQYVIPDEKRRDDVRWQARVMMHS